MIAGSWKLALIDVSADDDLSSEIDLGRAYENLVVFLPALTSTQISIKGATQTGGTFQDIYITDPADGSTTQPITDAGEGTIIWILPIGGFRYIKVAATDGQAEDRSIYVRGIRS